MSNEHLSRMTPAEEQERAIAWIVGSDTGTSSQTIWRVMMGVAKGAWWEEEVPHDPSDFGRCYWLFKRLPHWRYRLPEVVARHPTWGPLVREWDGLTQMYERVISGRSKANPDAWDRMASELMYERMRELIKEGEKRPSRRAGSA